MKREDIFKIRREFLEKTNLNSKVLRDILFSIGIKDNSVQLYFFLDSLLKVYSPSKLKDFFEDINEKISKGFISFRNFKYPLEEFYRLLALHKEKVIERKIKRYKVVDNKCPRCNRELKKGQPYCEYCNIYLRWS